MPDDTLPSDPTASTRRSFLARAGRGLAAATLAGGVLPVTARAAEKLKLPDIDAKTELARGPIPEPLPPEKRVGFAVVGLGHLALNQILPAFAECKQAKLVALVSGERDKAAQVAREYGVPEKGIYDYKTYDQLRDNPEVQVIYIVLPNGMHAEYTVRGAEAGKHILCEKPMANSVAECEQMIAACDKASKRLMIAYRIQYEPTNRLAQKWVREAKFGQVTLIESVNGQNQGDPNQWRHNKKLAGGGCLPDVGLYCLNTTRFLLGEEPTEVFAMSYADTSDARFKEIEETMIFQLRFPSGVLANCSTGYNFHESRRYRVNAERGWFGLDPAFSYKNLRMEASHAEGPVEHREQPGVAPKDHFAQEMDHMAGCVLENKKPYTPGEEGLQDQRIMEALYASAASGKPVKLTWPTGGKLDAFRGEVPKGEM